MDVHALATLPLSFQRGRADFTVDDAARLDALVADFSRALSHANVRLEVGGHTSAEGKAGVNRTLGRERALVVRRYLVEHSIPEARTTIVNYAATRPALAGVNMEANRRVTLRIVE
jgi:OOP family OmpA-OmpF porin